MLRPFAVRSKIKSHVQTWLAMVGLRRQPGRLAAAEAHAHPIKAMCEALEVSRSGYHRWRSAPTSVRALQTEAIRAKIARVHEASRGTYGSPRVAAALHGQGERVGRNRVARLMKEAGR